MKKIFSKISVVVLLIILSLSCSACTFIETKAPETVITDTQAMSQNVIFNGDETNLTPENPLSLTEAVKKVERTSVAIYTTDGAGSGVIIDMKDTTKTGSEKYVYVITCHHVIENKGPVEVIIPDQNCEYENEDYTFVGSIGNDTFASTNAVTLVGGDKDSDIALLKIDMTKPAVSGNVLAQNKIVKAKVPEIYALAKGESIFSIGNPTGLLPGSVSDGIVSYLERDVNIDGIGAMKLLQISVTTNPGNSGGGLYNLKGELVGITNAGNTSYEAINYAIPAVLSNGNGFKNMSAQLLASETSTNYGFISGRKEKFGFTSVYNQEYGYVYVQSVNVGSIAESAGLCVNDMINSIVKPDGTEVTIAKLSDLSAVMSALQVGQTVTIKVTRLVGYDLVKTQCVLTAKQYHFCNTGK